MREQQTSTTDVLEVANNSTVIQRSLEYGRGYEDTTNCYNLRTRSNKQFYCYAMVLKGRL